MSAHIEELEQDVEAASTPGTVTHEMRDKPRPKNLMETLRDKRNALTEDRMFEIPVPGYDELLVVRYRKAIGWLEMKNIIEKLEKDKKPYAALLTQCQIIIAMTEGIYVREDEDSDLQQLLVEDTGAPMLWDQHLASYFGLPDVEKASDVLRAVYSNDIAVGATQAALLKWTQGVDEQMGHEIEGNS